MTQSAVYQSVARATGESLRRLRRLGFRLLAAPKSAEAQTTEPLRSAPADHDETDEANGHSWSR